MYRGLSLTRIYSLILSDEGSKSIHQNITLGNEVLNYVTAFLPYFTDVHMAPTFWGAWSIHCGKVNKWVSHLKFCINFVIFCTKFHQQILPTDVLLISVDLFESHPFAYGKKQLLFANQTLKSLHSISKGRAPCRSPREPLHATFFRCFVIYSGAWNRNDRKQQRAYRNWRGPKAAIEMIVRSAWSFTDSCVNESSLIESKMSLSLISLVQRSLEKLSFDVIPTDTPQLPVKLSILRYSVSSQVRLVNLGLLISDDLSLFLSLPNVFFSTLSRLSQCLPGDILLESEPASADMLVNLLSCNLWVPSHQLNSAIGLFHCVSIIHHHRARMIHFKSLWWHRLLPIHSFFHFVLRTR